MPSSFNFPSFRSRKIVAATNVLVTLAIRMVWCGRSLVYNNQGPLTFASICQNLTDFPILRGQRQDMAIVVLLITNFYLNT